ncbi:MAG: class I SAM-dependent methyltransferase [Phycisphaeraceae bacterium]|nr:class I SAM-dependent methyltransferase [Phycisphaeraceae bacterium]
MARWLKSAGVGEKSRVLDLGCGKGAVAVEIARAIGCFVTGVDAFEPFVMSCRGLAAVKGVGSRCDFRVGLAERVGSTRYDAVVLLNLFPYERAIPIARRLTKPGGYYLLDDAVAVGAGAKEASFPTARDVAEAIEFAGDRVARFKVWTKPEVQRRERANYELLRRNAAELARASPKDGSLLSECLRRQRAGIAELSGVIRPACWLVRRGKA